MNEPLFSPLDHQFSRFLTRRSGLPESETATFELLIKRLSASLTAGHSCLSVTGDEEQVLSQSPMVSQGPATPLILWRGRLYLQRYFRYESRLARQLKALAAGRPTPPPLPGELDACFDRDQDNLQRRAAELALTRPLALISGGPGTGKTSTVARILGLLLLTGRPGRLSAIPGSGDTGPSLAGGRPSSIHGAGDTWPSLAGGLQIALAAPTGKAAMRLAQSITAGLAALPFPESVKTRIPATASTLHRLLGVRLYSPHFRHHQDNPLPWDVVVVDEASMVDLALMSKLVDALKPGSRLILLGDKDQLASVESGAVLADCIAALPDNTVTLHKSYRFNQEISAFARAVNANDSVAAWGMIKGGEAEDRKQESEIRSQKAGETAETERSLVLLREPMIDFIVSRYGSYMDEIAAFSGSGGQTAHLRRLFAALGRFRVLCATRQGAGGVETINRQVEQRLAHLSAGSGPSPVVKPGGWYPGRPVIILTNDYSLNLFNGDIGICLPDPAAPETLKVWFEKEDGTPVSFPPYRLPACETVFAMTIHKSQGSEFSEVLVCLPPADSPLLTRELTYTAITRARDKVVIAGSQEIFQAAVNRNISRAGGLLEMLTGS